MKVSEEPRKEARFMKVSKSHESTVSWSHETERSHAERKESEKQVGDMKLILKVGKNCEVYGKRQQ
jgi:hypothetical protein